MIGLALLSDVCCCARLNFSLELSGVAPVPPAHSDMDNLPMILSVKGVTRAMLQFFNRRAGEAVATLDGVAQCHLDAQQLNALNVFFLALALIEACPKCTLAPYSTMLSADDVPSMGLPLLMPPNYDGALVIQTLQRVDALIAQMSIWADRASCNFLHRLHLMRAERNRLVIFSHLAHFALLLPTMQLYEAAIEGAHRNQYPLDEALSLELSARYCTHSQRFATARGIFLRAYSAYDAFGAGMKLRQLEAEFPNILFQVAAELGSPSSPLLHDQANAHAQSNKRSASPSRSTSLSPPSVPTPRTTTGSSTCALTLDCSKQHSVVSSVSPTIAASSSSSVVAQCTSSSSAKAAGTGCGSGSVCLADSSSALDALSALKAVASFSVEKDQDKLLKRIMNVVLETAGATRGCLVLQNAQQEWCVQLGGSVEVDETDMKEPTVKEEEDATATGAPASPSAQSAQGGGESSDQPASSIGSTAGSTDGPFRSPPQVASLESALPASVFQFVLSSMETLLISDSHKQSDSTYSTFTQDPYFDTHHPRALLCMPVLRAGAVFGVLYLENDYRSAAFTSSHIQLLQLLCSQAALSIDNARLYAALSETNASLELQVQARTAELEEKNRQLSAAKEAAEAATKIKADFLSNM